MNLDGVNVPSPFEGFNQNPFHPISSAINLILLSNVPIAL